jgi:hypothetical protein
MKKLFNIQSDYAILIAEATNCHECISLKRSEDFNRDLDSNFYLSACFAAIWQENE